MLKTVVFWLLLQPLAFICPDGNGADTCPAVTNLHKTAGITSSYSLAWSGVGQATQYKVWCVRKSDGYLVSTVFITGTSHTFYNLLPGAYYFYVATICSEETSDFIGIEDLIEI